MTPKLESPREIYQIKVTLLGSQPPIWRRLLVSADTTLKRLHEIVQLAMGWQDCHLHDFQIGRERFATPDPNDGLLGPSGAGDERTVRMCNVLSKVGAKAVYTYDFGDGWEHSIAVEKVLPPEPGLAYPLCLAGKRHGPPEDCGGIHGYYNLLEIMGDPEHSEYEEMKEWIGENFDPENFSVDEVNRRLAPLRRRRAKAKEA